MSTKKTGKGKVALVEAKIGPLASSLPRLYQEAGLSREKLAALIEERTGESVADYTLTQWALRFCRQSFDEMRKAALNADGKRP